MNASRTECDVLVVGGGAAGIAAAAAAARSGAQVLWWERYAYLGGMATAGMVGTVCGLFLRDTTGSSPRLASGGFVAEFAAKAALCSGTAPIRMSLGLWVLPCPPRAFERAAQGVAGEDRNITLGLHATVTGVRREGDTIGAVTALVWNELVTAYPRCVVDCTGEATVAALAGAPTDDGSADQTPSLVFELTDVDEGLVRGGMLPTLLGLRHAVEQGQLPAGSDRLWLVPGAEPGGSTLFKLSLPSRSDLSPSWRRMTGWEQQGRERVEAIYRFLAANDAHFRRSRLSQVAAQLGVRSGRRIRGQATLADEDVLSARKFADGIARGAWPMERWGDGLRPAMGYFEEGGYYEIPLGCLRPAGVDNLLVAGRCLSATPGALASARVIGTSLATGWAAGLAAAGYATGEPMADQVGEIRRQMDA